MSDRQSLITELIEYQPFNILEGAHVSSVVQFMRENDDCFERSNLAGHLTGSGWIVDDSYSHCLLIHHKKLNRWLQPGGHADGNQNIQQVALKEVEEETGIKDILPVAGIFDVDVHLIPGHKGIPEHYHYDIRYLFITSKQTPLMISDESNDLKWFPLENLMKWVGAEPSILRLQEKSLHLP